MLSSKTLAAIGATKNMKLEYLDNINDAGDKIVRLYDFDPIQADKLRKTIQLTIIENKNELDLATIEFVETINCFLTFRIADTDKGLVTADTKIFFCDLSVESYKHMTNLLAPFCDKQQNGHQWLFDIETPIDLLFSPIGNW